MSFFVGPNRPKKVNSVKKQRLRATDQEMNWWQPFTRGPSNRLKKTRWSNKFINAEYLRGKNCKKMAPFDHDFKVTYTLVTW